MNGVLAEAQSITEPSRSQMLKSKTVFVIGAGASCEVGLPSGYELKKQIATLLDIRFEDGWSQSSGDPDICAVFRALAKLPDGRGGNINHYLEKCWKIRDVIPAAALSIDNYLDAHAGDSELELCGKLGIAKAILHGEKKSTLFGVKSDGYLKPFMMSKVEETWLVALMNLLTEGVHKDNVDNLFSNVSFIVFNYDRCLEWFLVRIFTDYYGLPELEAQQRASSAIIYHPYGQVGPLLWQEGGNKVAFGQTDHIDLLGVAKQIKTFTEKLENKNQLESMRLLIESASQIIFLGFAYHDQNLKLITPAEASSATRVFGTNMGISYPDSQVILGEIQGMLGGVIKSTSINFVTDKCSVLFKTHWRGLSA